MTEILISGGGIAGCAAALALHRAGVQVSVHEAHPTSSEDLGSFLIAPSGGVQVLEELGVLDSLEEITTPLARMTVLSPDASKTFVSRSLASEGAPKYRLVRRGALVEVLQQQVEAAGIPLHRGSRVVAAAGRIGDVQACTEIGEKYHADLIVAADGLGSALRPVVNPNDPAARYVGQLLFWGFTKDRRWGTVDDMHVMTGPDLAFGYIPIDSGTYWFARVDSPEKSREELARFDFSAFLDNSLIALPKEIAATATPYASGSYDLPFVSAWSGQGVLLIGDAAHAASPATGQGGGYALEDALVLGKAVRDRGDLASALDSYERARRGRTQANVVASARMCTGPETLADAPQGQQIDPAAALSQVRWSEPLPA